MEPEQDQTRKRTDEGSEGGEGEKRQRTEVTASESGEGLGEASAPLASPRSIPAECVPQEYDVELDVDMRDEAQPGSTFSFGGPVLGMTIGEVAAKGIVVLSFLQKADRTMGTAEASGVRIGHVLMAIDGVPVADKTFIEVPPPPPSLPPFVPPHSPSRLPCAFVFRDATTLMVLRRMLCLPPRSWAY